MTLREKPQGERRERAYEDTAADWVSPSRYALFWILSRAPFCRSWDVMHLIGNFFSKESEEEGLKRAPRDQKKIIGRVSLSPSGVFISSQSVFLGAAAGLLLGN